MKRLIRVLIVAGVLAVPAWIAWDHVTSVPAGTFNVACTSSAGAAGC